MTGKSSWNWLLRLIDYSYNIQASDFSSILGSMTLGISEVSRNSDHSTGDLKKVWKKDIESRALTEIVFFFANELIPNRDSNVSGFGSHPKIDLLGRG